jgi:curved DNA-binding protein CbpA
VQLVAKDSLYAVLGLRRDADPAVVAAAYKALAKKHHPDVAGGDKHAAAEKFNAIHAAFEVLGDPEKRKLYDASPLFSPGDGRPKPLHAAAPDSSARAQRGAWKIRVLLACFVIIAALKFSMVWFEDRQIDYLGELQPRGSQTDQAYGAGKGWAVPGSKFSDRVIMNVNSSSLRP